MQYNFTDVAIDLQDKVITHLVGQSSIKLTRGILNNNKNKAKIFAFKQLSLDDIRLVLDDEPSIDITKIVLDDLLFSKKASLTDAVAQKVIAKINKISAKDGIDILAKEVVNLPPVMQLKQLTLNNLHIHDKSITINSIIFDTLSGNIIIKENKELVNLVALGNQTDVLNYVEPKPIEAVITIEKELQLKDTEANNDGFVFSLNELRFINKNSFGFADSSVDPIYQRTLYLYTVDMGALSNKKKATGENTIHSYWSQ